RIVGEAREDGLTGEAAKVAYYFFLSIWPLFLGLFAFTGIFGGEPAFVILIWLYLTALAILFGGEVAVSLEQGLHEDG
ncbi:MAG TPA: hypothetical protein VM778_11420, partial [Gemmatimonadota bacterium]|nr:hypothetical protein [Gemmatimonadota bacterium]